jgi:hypothetical protein
MNNEDITKFSGIYEYLYDNDERHLSIRAFTPKMARAAYERQKDVCAKCENTLELKICRQTTLPLGARGQCVR